VDPEDLVSKLLRNVDNYQMTWRRIPQGLKYGVQPVAQSPPDPVSSRVHGAAMLTVSRLDDRRAFLNSFSIFPSDHLFRIQSGGKATGTVA